VPFVPFVFTNGTAFIPAVMPLVPFVPFVPFFYIGLLE